MKPELKTKWLDALRSGNYKKCCHYLNYGGCYCVLGVLCDISEIPVTGKEGKAIKYDKKIHFPSAETLEAIELSKDLAADLANLNDKGLSFKELADIIEEKVN